MDNFNPTTLKNDLETAVEILNTYLDSNLEFGPELYLYFDDNHTEPLDTLSASSLVTLYLPRAYEGVDLTCSEIIALAREVPTIKGGNDHAVSNKRILYKVETLESFNPKLHETLPDALENDQSSLLEEYAKVREELADAGQLVSEHYGLRMHRQKSLTPEQEAQKKRYNVLLEKSSSLGSQIKEPKRYFLNKTEINGREHVLSLTHGVTLFAFYTVHIGNYSKEFPPILDDYFVEIQYDNKPSDEILENLLYAYLFELDSNLGLQLKRTSREHIDSFYYSSEERYPRKPRFRPLLIGEGARTLLELYYKAVATQDVDVQILYFTKIVEYVSQTVIKQRLVSTVRGKLLSPRALQPDALYISELAELIEFQRIYKSDREAIKQTIITCCEASELAKVSPTIKSLAKILPGSKDKEKEASLSSFAETLYATRNEIAHAKTNYEPTGDECPNEERTRFVVAVKLAAQQVINWYQAQSDVMRFH